MTIVRRKNDEIMVGVSVCDNMIDTTERDLTLEENIPFWKPKNTKDLYVFSGGVNLATDLLRYHDYIFKDVTDGQSIINNVVPKMKELLGKYSSIKDDEEWFDELLLIKGNKMYLISNYFVVKEVDDFEALDSNYRAYMLGCAEAYKDMPLKESIICSMRTLERVMNKKLFPMILVDMKTKKRKVISH